MFDTWLGPGDQTTEVPPAASRAQILELLGAGAPIDFLIAWVEHWSDAPPVRGDHESKVARLHRALPHVRPVLRFAAPMAAAGGTIVEECDAVEDGRAGDGLTRFETMAYFPVALLLELLQTEWSDEFDVGRSASAPFDRPIMRTGLAMALATDTTGELAKAYRQFRRRTRPFWNIPTGLPAPGKPPMSKVLPEAVVAAAALLRADGTVPVADRGASPEPGQIPHDTARRLNAEGLAELWTLDAGCRAVLAGSEADASLRADHEIGTP